MNYHDYENNLITKIRWWLFKQISVIGWKVCPEPHRTNLQIRMATWNDLES